jgi:hypothetical protein
MLHSVQKQLLINQLGSNLYWSNDLLNIIKDYCFYETKTYNMIKKIKFKKAEINYIVRRVLLFYNFQTGFNYYHSGVVMHTLDDELPKIHIDNNICNTCGNYINDILKTHIPKKIICKCH